MTTYQFKSSGIVRSTYNWSSSRARITFSNTNQPKTPLTHNTNGVGVEVANPASVISTAQEPGGTVNIIQSKGYVTINQDIWYSIEYEWKLNGDYYINVWYEDYSAKPFTSFGVYGAVCERRGDASWWSVPYVNQVCVNHTSSSWQSDAHTHWQICDNCNQPYNQGSHTLNSQGVCTGCGGKFHTHSWSWTGDQASLTELTKYFLLKLCSL